MRLVVSFLIVCAMSAIEAQVPDTESAATAVGTAVTTPPSTPQACGSDITGTKPKIYIANFLVTYGQKSMGRLVADNIAFKFETDDRFEIIPRKIINREMSPYFKKSLQAEEYLNLAVTLAGEKQADCVIFGKISKSGTKISFLVRMASVATGENRKKIDQDVDRKEAAAFFENTSSELVAYFSTAPPPPVAAPEPPPKKESPSVTMTFWGGYNIFVPDSQAQQYIDFMKSIPGSTSNVGGISGGADLWFRATNGVDLGIGVGYLSIWQYKFTYSSGGNTFIYDESIRLVPVTGQLRFISGVGLYLAAGGGYYVAVGEGSVTINSYRASGSGTKSAFGFNGALGLQVKLGEAAVMDIGAKLWYVLLEGTGMQVTPFAGFGFRF